MHSQQVIRASVKMEHKRIIEQVNCIHFEELLIMFFLSSETLAAGTNMGNIAMWKHEELTSKNDEYAKDPEKEWKLQPPTALSGAVTSVI